MEFLVDFEVKVPDDEPEPEVERREAEEAAAAARLAREGHLVRLWKRPVVAGTDWQTISPDGVVFGATAPPRCSPVWPAATPSMPASTYSVPRRRSKPRRRRSTG
jgi:Muconolactone delta-isomerase